MYCCETKLLRFCSDQFEVNGDYDKQSRPIGNTAQTTFHRGLHCILGQIRIPLIYNLVLIAHAKMSLINAHVYVSKVRYSMGYFDSENTGGITYSIRVCSVFYDNIDLQRKKCGISNLVVKGIKIHLQVYIDNICISHMRKSP